jgi:hypothetical protein
VDLRVACCFAQAVLATQLEVPLPSDREMAWTQAMWVFMLAIALHPTVVM